MSYSALVRDHVCRVAALFFFVTLAILLSDAYGIDVSSAFEPLRRDISIDEPNANLRSAAKVLSQKFGMPIRLDEAAIRRLKIDADRAFPFKVEKRSGAEAVGALLLIASPERKLCLVARDVTLETAVYSIEEYVDDEQPILLGPMQLERMSVLLPKP